MSPEVKRIYYKHFNLYQTIITILQCLTDISLNEYPSPDLLIDVLKGYESSAIVKHFFYKCQSYGKLFYVSKDDLKFIINWLCKNRFIFRDGRFSPKLHPTKRGREAEKYMTAEMMKELAVELGKREKWKLRAVSSEQRGKDKIAEAIFSDFDKNKHFCRT